MNRRIAMIVFATLFASTGSVAGLAHAESVSAIEPRPDSAHSTLPTGQSAPFGYQVSGKADRIVTIDRDTRYLNVTRLETVTINVDGKSLTWNFDTLTTRAFALSRIIPGVDNVTVYVSESPLYTN